VTGVEEATTTPEAATVERELAAMRKLHTALTPLDEAAQKRVLLWLFARYGIGEEAGT
jgi:hypothetical protein